MRALFPTLPSPDLASSVMAAHVLSPIAGSLLLVAAFSAIMSTVNAILLIGAASVAHDLYGRFLKPGASETARLTANRLAVLALALAPAWFAIRFSSAASKIRRVPSSSKAIRSPGTLYRDRRRF